MTRPIDILVLVLLLIWLVGAFVVPVGGRMIHELLILAFLLGGVRVLLALGLFPRPSPATGPVVEWDEDIRLPK
jgi:hypothetical protein